jgi:hypothetical protein
MNSRSFAIVLGIAFLLAGAAGFFPSPLPPDAPPVTVHQFHGLALGLFPVNILHNIVHLLFGLLGLAAAAGTILSARAYARLVAVSYALLVLLGLLPATQTTFGLIPIWGNDVWLHAALAIPAAYFGFSREAAPLRATI